MIEDIETAWSRELRSDVSFAPASNGEYALYVDGFYELTGNMVTLEDYLHRIAIHTPEVDGF